MSKYLNFPEEQLEEMLYSNNWLEREAVANQGYKLDVLVNDVHPFVREAVAKQGYGLDKLINDENRFVRDVACMMLDKKHDYKTVEDIILSAQDKASDINKESKFISSKEPEKE